MAMQLTEKQSCDLLAQFLMDATSAPDATSRKNAKDQLDRMENEPMFPSMLMTLINDPERAEMLRLAGAIHFKNFIKRNWNTDEGPAKISPENRNSIKSNIVDVLINVPEKLQLQISDAVSIIAETDFYEEWQSLLPDLVKRLSPTDYKINNGILQTVHSIFEKWRAEFRTDNLFAEIKYSLETFCDAYHSLFMHTDKLISEYPNNPAVLTILSQSLILLIDIFYDFNCQDLPEYFEDNMNVFAELFLKYLDYSNPLLMTTDEDGTPGPLEKVKAGICDIFDLYLRRNESVLLEAFMVKPNDGRERQMVRLFGSLCKHLKECSLGSKYDDFVGKAFSVLTLMLKYDDMRFMFVAPEEMFEAFVLKNIGMRDVDEELFEDNPIEYIRRDLEGSDSGTRRRAAVDFIRALAAIDQAKVTGIVNKYIALGLDAYSKNKLEWKSKDTAMSLFIAITAVGTTELHGVTKTNQHVDTAGFFNTNVLPELKNTGSNVGDLVLKVDAVKVIYLFRSQLPKENLVMLFEPLMSLMASQSFVVYTYTAITIERILRLRQGKGALFTSADIKNYMDSLLGRLFDLILQDPSPERVAENDYLMQAIMRVLITARQDIAPIASTVMGRLIHILDIISKNPSNPQFNHYTFESIGAIIRFVCPVPGLDASTKGQLFAVFQSILTQYTDFAPYVFQILALFLEQHQGAGLPAEYNQLLDMILAPEAWIGGNIPALVRLLQAYLRADANTVLAMKKLDVILGVFQGKLVTSQKFDHHGMALMNTIIQTIPNDVLSNYLKALVASTLTRLMSKRKGGKIVSDLFTQNFALWMCQAFITDKLGGPDTIIGVFEELQGGLFIQVMNSTVLNDVASQRKHTDTNICAIGLAQLLTQSMRMREEPFNALWAVTAKTLIKLQQTVQAVTPQTAEDEADRLVIGNIEEETGLTFSRLTMTTPASEDPTASYPPLHQYLKQHVTTLQDIVSTINATAAHTDKQLIFQFTQKAYSMPTEDQNQLIQWINAIANQQ